MTSLILILILIFLVTLLSRWVRRRRVAAYEIVQNTKILVCSLGKELPGNLEERDASIYSDFYRHVDVLKSQEIEALLASIGNHAYDIVHLFCEIDDDGNLIGEQGSRLRGHMLLESCHKADVKLLFVANDNQSEGYMKAFDRNNKPAGLRLNSVWTIERKGDRFFLFLSELLKRMSKGMTLPMAWNEISPLGPDDRDRNEPRLVGFIDRGNAKLLP